jgi:hypothetical protein
MIMATLVAGAVMAVQSGQATEPAAVVQPATRPSNVTLRLLDMKSATVTTDSTEEKTVEMEGGTRVLVRRGSTVRHAALPGASRGGMLELKGEAAIEVTQAQLFLRVVSRAGSATLMPGLYALRCAAACEALEVSVARGLASLTADAKGTTPIPLETGQWGRAFRDSLPVRVDSAQAKHFPVAESTHGQVNKPGTMR